MSKSNSGSNKDDIIISNERPQLDEKKIRKIRKTLLSITEMDIKASKIFNIIVIKKDENENRIAIPTFIPQRNNNVDFARIDQSEANIENDTDFDTSELADSSDFENEGDEF